MVNRVECKLRLSEFVCYNVEVFLDLLDVVVHDAVIDDVGFAVVVLTGFRQSVCHAAQFRLLRGKLRNVNEQLVDCDAELRNNGRRVEDVNRVLHLANLQ